MKIEVAGHTLNMAKSTQAIENQETKQEDKKVYKHLEVDPVKISLYNP